MDRGFNRHLAMDLFETGCITTKIVDGQSRSDQAQKERKMRLGYMGHLTLVAEEVVKFTERQAPESLDQDVLDKITDPSWSHYVENILTETRDRDNAILGGVKPETNMGAKQTMLNAVTPGQGGYGNSTAVNDATTLPSPGVESMDIANAGTTGYNFNNAALLSGFGNSDDEDEDELDEGEFRQESSTSAHHSQLDEDYQVGDTSAATN